MNLLNCVEAFDLAEQDERVQVVVGHDELLQAGEALQLLQVLVVDYEVKAHIDQVHFFHLIVKLAALQDLQRVAVDIEHLIRLNLGMARLHDRLLIGSRSGLPLAHLLLVEAVDLALPLLLNDLYDVAFVLRLENGQLDFDGPFFDHSLVNCSLQGSLSVS